MKHKKVVSVFVLALSLLVQLPVVSTRAQSTDLEAQKKEIARAKDTIKRLRAGKTPTKEELDILENLLTRLEKANSHEDATGEAAKSKVSPGASDKREPKPSPQLAVGLSQYSTGDGPVYMYTVDLDTSLLRAFWRDRRGEPYGSITRLREGQYREGATLEFAMNGGIFDQRNHPKGLYIEQGKVLSEVDIASPGADMGNFYLEPNGVFVIDVQGDARILTTRRFLEQFSLKSPELIRLAVQSGPALLVDGEINRLFTEASSNKKRRSGVGILGPRRVVFAMSSGETSFYEFAAAFAAVGCRDALYLDGGPIPALYIRADKLSISVDSPLVTMFGVFDRRGR